MLMPQQTQHKKQSNLLICPEHTELEAQEVCPTAGNKVGPIATRGQRSVWRASFLPAYRLKLSHAFTNINLGIRATSICSKLKCPHREKFYIFTFIALFVVLSQENFKKCWCCCSTLLYVPPTHPGAPQISMLSFCKAGHVSVIVCVWHKQTKRQAYSIYRITITMHFT